MKICSYVTTYLPIFVYQNHTKFSTNSEVKEVRQAKKSICIAKQKGIKNIIVNKLVWHLGNIGQLINGKYSMQAGAARPDCLRFQR
jgi:hypothetical protein